MTGSTSQPPVLGNGAFKIKIVGSLDIFKEVDCNVKFAKSLSNITREYATFIGVEHDSVEFTFNGKKVKHVSTPRSLKMITGDIIQVERKSIKSKSRALPKIPKSNEKESVDNATESVESKSRALPKIPKSNETESPDANNVYESNIQIKMIRKFDQHEANLLVKRYTNVHEMRNAYMKKVGLLEKPTLVYNGRILTENYTTLKGLEMKDNDTVIVYTDEIPISIKVSFHSDIAKEANFIVKFGDSFANSLNAFSTMNRLDINTVTFMNGSRRITPVNSPKHIGIITDANIEVIMTTISLTVINIKDESEEFRMKVNYFDTFWNIKKEYARLGADPLAIEFSYKGHRVLDNQTPKELDMIDNDTIEFYKQMVTTLQFIVDQRTPIGNCCVKGNTTLDAVLKKYAEISLANNSVKLQYDSLKFIYQGHRIRPGNTPAHLKMKENAVIEVKEKSTVSLKFVVPVKCSDEVTISANVEDQFVNIKQKYADLVEENVNNLKFMLNGKRILDTATPEFLQKGYALNENDLIEVLPEDEPSEFFTVKMIDMIWGGEVIFRTTSNTPLEEVNLLYADHVGQCISSLIFLYNNQRISCDDTPKSLHMKEDNVIEVYEGQYGGPYHFYFTCNLNETM